MNIRIKTTDYEMPSEVAEYLNTRLESIEKMLSDTEGTLCDVEIGRASGHSIQGEVWRAEIVLMHKGDRFVATETAESVNAAIDAVKDEMQQQLRKKKGKEVSLTRRVGARMKEWLRFGGR